MPVVLKETRQGKDTVLSKIRVTTEAGLETQLQIQGLYVNPKKLTPIGSWIEIACEKVPINPVLSDSSRINQVPRRTSRNSLRERGTHPAFLPS